MIKETSSTGVLKCLNSVTDAILQFFKMFNKGLASAAADNEVGSIGTFISTLTIALQPGIEFFSFEVEFFTLGAEMRNLFGTGKFVEVGRAYVKVLTSLIEIEGCFL